MRASSTPPESLDESIERRRLRRAQWERDGERSLGQNLAMIGALGWQIVVPALGGVFLGQWIDRSAGTGIIFTGALLAVGVAVGCWLAWKRVQSR